MTDPTDALISFQAAIDEIEVQRGELHQDVYVHMDCPNGEVRLTYVKLEGKFVTALSIIVTAEPLNGLQCFSIGYAVPEAYRGQGQAKAIVEAAIAELANGLKRNALTSFYVEAIVGADNLESKGVAAQTLSSKPKPTIDSVSGQSALQYVRKVDD